MKLMNKEQVCEHLDISPRCLDGWVADCRFPPPQRIGKRGYWTEAAVERWVQLFFMPQESWQPQNTDSGWSQKRSA